MAFKRFTTKQLIFIALSGALLFVLSFTLGSALIVITGIPAGSGFITALIQGIIVAIVATILKRFGTVTIMYLIYAVLVLPTNMLGTPPGVHKLIIGLSIGLIFDIVYSLTKYKRYGLYLASIINGVVSLPVYLSVYYFMGFPGLDKLISVMPGFMTIMIAELLVGTFIGFKIYDKIKDKRVVRQILAQ